jgi:hypothetical protein
VKIKQMHNLHALTAVAYLNEESPSCGYIKLENTAIDYVFEVPIRTFELLGREIALALNERQTGTHPHSPGKNPK